MSQLQQPVLSAGLLCGTGGLPGCLFSAPQLGPGLQCLSEPPLAALSLRPSPVTAPLPSSFQKHHLNADES